MVLTYGRNATGWSLGTGWSATTKVIKETNAASTRFHRALSQGDVDIRFRYMTTDTTAGLFGEMCFRTISNNVTQNNVVVRMATDGMKLQKVYLGNTTVLDTNTSATSTANTWYRVRILAKGSNVTVWRGEGDDGPMEEVLSTTVAPTLTPASMWFISGASAAFAYDDIEVVADGWTGGTTFATNGGNELTSSTFGGVTTTYGYDAWGNMTSKARGSHTATYGWHYGGKLTGVTSDFPSEGTVTYAYGRDGIPAVTPPGNGTDGNPPNGPGVFGPPRGSPGTGLGTAGTPGGRSGPGARRGVGRSRRSRASLTSG